jgi:osmotically-inducible protein OsmY
MSDRRHYGSAILAGVAVLLTGALAGAVDDAAIQGALEARLQKEKLARKEARTVHNQLRVHLEEPVKDAEIVEGVRSAILGDPRYHVFDYVEFAVNDGAVALLGSVSQPWKKSSIESRVARVPGVRAIQNDITVQSLSRFDSNLRASLARRIYGDVRFVQYANRSHPPIRILVDRGHVVLAGWVRSPVEKAVLGHIARSTPSFSVENRLRPKATARRTRPRRSLVSTRRGREPSGPGLVVPPPPGAMGAPP